jgi:hypothetical protein
VTVPRFVVVATIDPARLDVLVARRAEHYAFLLAQAQAFVDAEPYHAGGGFSSVTVRPWRQVLPEPAPGSLQRTLDAERATADPRSRGRSDGEGVA